MRADVSYTYADIGKAESSWATEPKVSVATACRQFFDVVLRAVGRPGSR